MKKLFPLWILGLVGILLLIIVPVLYFLPRADKPSTNPEDYLPTKPVHVDHTDIVNGDFKTGQAVTRACLECHKDAATELLKTSHWTWESKEFNVPWRDDGFWSVPMRINAVRLGDLALVTFAAETFTEIGMKVRVASPAAHTLFASVSDGCISYLHTEESHPEGGYEVDIAPLAYRYPGRLQTNCEGIALETTNTLSNQLWRRHDDN